MLRMAIVLMLLLVLPSAAWARAKRVALVIGNSEYQHTPKLANPKHDASDVGAALKKHGFHVIEGFDLDKAGIDQKIQHLANAMEGAEWAFSSTLATVSRWPGKTTSFQ